ncbi:MAG: hypothetical protein M1821_003929 [Bathelium mastoideum]|nr:MAG: hypothetical protein M1821_003929 [Bathelium mastoideum]KAI9691006.1 MAG: hypothetical protein M1822_008626 [Bathelium mastoideum]
MVGDQSANEQLSFWMRFIYTVIEAVNIGGFSITGVGMLAFLTAPLPLVFLLYHIHLIWTGMTTNETVKWSDWRDDMADGVVFKAKRSEVLSTKALQSLHPTADTSLRNENGTGESLSNGNSQGGNPKEIYVDWPVHSDQFLVRTASGRPPAGAQSQTDIWMRCWRLNDVANIYDLGFWDNLRDVLRG